MEAPQWRLCSRCSSWDWTTEQVLQNSFHIILFVSNPNPWAGNSILQTCRDWWHWRLVWEYPGTDRLGHKHARGRNIMCAFMTQACGVSETDAVEGMYTGDTNAIQSVDLILDQRTKLKTSAQVTSNTVEMVFEKKSPKRFNVLAQY